MIADCKAVGKESLDFFATLKQERLDSDDIESGTKNLQLSIRKLQEHANVCQYACCRHHT